MGNCGTDSIVMEEINPCLTNSAKEDMAHLIRNTSNKFFCSNFIERKFKCLITYGLILILMFQLGSLIVDKMSDENLNIIVKNLLRRNNETLYEKLPEKLGASLFNLNEKNVLHTTKTMTNIPTALNKETTISSHVIENTTGPTLFNPDPEYTTDVN